jgi:hypothetical protein
MKLQSCSNAYASDECEPLVVQIERDSDSVFISIVDDGPLAESDDDDDDDDISSSSAAASCAARFNAA